MQKKIIVLAIAAALTPAIAMADTANVTVYGTVDASYDFVTTGDGNNGSNKGTSEQRVSGNQSYVGLKGSSDLGNGLSATWQAEGKINLDGTGYSFDRDTFAGLSSATMGTVRIGRMASPYKASTRKQDVFADSIADNRSLMGGVAVSTGVAALMSTSFPSTNATQSINSAIAFDGRNSQTLAYTSPSFSGVTVAAALVNFTASNIHDSDSKVRATSLAAMYDVAPFYATIAYEVHNFTKLGTGVSDVSEKAAKFGLGYTMDQLAVNFVYEKTSDDFGKIIFGGLGYDNVLGHNAMTLNGKFNISSTDAIKAAYTKAGSVGDSASGWTNNSAKQMSIGYDHSMSKNTTAYAIYTKLSNDNNISYALYGSQTNSGNWDGASPSALSLGVKHAF